MSAGEAGTPRTAIVHEWVSARAGSEKVFEAMAQVFPEADLYALSVDRDVGLDLHGRTVRTTFLDRPVLAERRALTLPLMPLAWRRMSGGTYDSVITSHHAFAHSNHLVKDGGTHHVYVHSPARYIWSPEIDGRASGKALAPLRAALRRLDAGYARRPTSYAANSAAVRDRIRRFYGRDASVIWPPVDIDDFRRPRDVRPTRDYLLAVGRWIPYKRFGFCIAVAEAAGLPIVVAGSGPLEGELRATASRSTCQVSFVRTPTDEQLRELYWHARALLFPAVEDFGMVPVECQAGGTPVVALNAGGARETVVEGCTGLLVDELDVARFADAVRAVPTLPTSSFDEHVARFAPHQFDARLRKWVSDAA